MTVKRDFDKFFKIYFLNCKEWRKHVVSIIRNEDIYIGIKTSDTWMTSKLMKPLVSVSTDAEKKVAPLRDLL